ncbi:hypothetical protein C8C83_0554 [Flavobacterium sp. 90]|nr:hypothetical protein C8C82_0849 [Flavobacterium sp. 81]TCK52745.1 hypothetical protein C8C83_0554 [Flavobacterium sp. 90]
MFNFHVSKKEYQKTNEADKPVCKAIFVIFEGNLI